MKRLAIFAVSLIVCFSAVRAKAEETSWLSHPRSEALRLAQEWSLKEPKLVETDTTTVETTAGGTVVVGRRLLQSLRPSQEAQDVILTFILLHEFWHVKQMELVDAALLEEAKERPVLECQADVEAGRLVILNFLQIIADFADKDQIASASKSIDGFKSSWTLLVDRSPAESDFHHHLTKKQRILALQFALWRAYYEKFQSASNPTKQLAALIGKLKSRADANESVPVHDWSRLVCERIVKYDAEVFDHLYLMPEPSKGLGDDGLDEIKITAKNNSARDIQLAATVVSGHFPKGREQEFQEYVFIDSSSNTMVIKPGEKATLTFNVTFPRVPEGSDVFIWQTPWQDRALFGARYASPPRPPLNCTEKWSLGGLQIDPTLADISRLSSYAADRFNGAWTRANAFPGMSFNIQPSTVLVRGAIKTQVYLAGEPNAVATLYDGPDKSASLEKYKAAANAIRTACSALPEAIMEWIGSDSLPALRVERITAYSEATLSISAIKPKEAKDDTRTTYQTYWRVQYNPP